MAPAPRSSRQPRSGWAAIAARAVRGLDVQPGHVVHVRDDSGRFDVLQEVLLAVELAGATPLPQLTSPAYMERLWRAGDPERLARWDQHRLRWLAEADRILSLAGAMPDFKNVPEAHFQAWTGAEQRLTELEEARQIPYLVMAVATEQKAAELKMSLADLEALLLPALRLSVGALQREMGRVLDAVGSESRLTLISGDNERLVLDRSARRWLRDDGLIDQSDRAAGAIVSNLPAGSLYTTVIEDASAGSVFLPEVRSRQGSAADVVLRFAAGRIVDIRAGSGDVGAVESIFEGHSGEPRRVGHLGIGLNPALTRSIGWTLVDEHLPGRIFLSLGENRYMGGQNESSLNIDFALHGATLLAGDRPVVENGKIVV